MPSSCVSLWRVRWKPVAPPLPTSPMCPPICITAGALLWDSPKFAPSSVAVRVRACERIRVLLRSSALQTTPTYLRHVTRAEERQRAHFFPSLFFVLMTAVTRILARFLSSALVLMFFFSPNPPLTHTQIHEAALLSLCISHPQWPGSGPTPGVCPLLAVVR